MGNPHENNLNPNNQLALLAVNVLGEEFNPNCNDLSHLKLKHPDDTVEVALSSITDDLSYCMYVEESIVEIVKRLESLKHKAVEDERFEYARKLKLCMNCLRVAGKDYFHDPPPTTKLSFSKICRRTARSIFALEKTLGAEGRFQHGSLAKGTNGNVQASDFRKA